MLKINTNTKEANMDGKTTNKVHWSFWLISIVTLIWNVLGSVNFFVQMDPEMVASFRESEQAIILNRPVWATVSFGIAVFAGALGSLLLIFKKKLSLYLFVPSLLGVIITMVHTLTSGISFGTGEIVGIIVMPLLVAVFLVWYSKYTNVKGWLS